MLLGVVETLGLKQQTGEIQLGWPILGGEVDSGAQFAKGVRPKLLVKKTPSQLVVGIGEVLVDLDCVLELNVSFRVLALLRVLQAAFVIFLHADFRAAETTGRSQGEQGKQREKKFG